MAFEMMAIIVISIFLGKYIDGKIANDKQYATLALLLIGIISYLIKVVIDTSKK